MAYYIGIDIGGTFTDCAVLDGAGSIVSIAKAPTRRREPDQGVIDAVEAAARRMGIPYSELLRETRFFIHGCTVATNAIVERKGVTTALITTRGHEDAILIGKGSQKIAGLTTAEMTHQSHLDKAEPPIVKRRHIFGVLERVNSRGEVVADLDEDHLAAAIEMLRREKVEAVAISLLWSFLNNDHERRNPLGGPECPAWRLRVRLTRGCAVARRIRARSDDGCQRLCGAATDRLYRTARR